jgi:hypothetical protein
LDLETHSEISQTELTSITSEVLQEELPPIVLDSSALNLAFAASNIIPPEIPAPEFLTKELSDIIPESSTVDLQSTETETVQTNSQSKEIKSTTVMVDAKRMISPWAKDAPRFKSSDPGELLRFIDRMEGLFEEAGVEDHEKKKTTIGRYADAVSENEWKYFDSFEEGTWEEFKTELISNYPEAAAAERGTPERIRELCAETSRIRLGDMPSLLRFKRAFWTEAKKLLVEPEVMSNRELVELFIGCLTAPLASAILQHLGNTAASSRPKVKDKSGKDINRRPEDKYDLADVCKAAVVVSEDSQGMYNLLKKASSGDREVLMFGQSPSESKILSDKVEELEGVQALEKDKADSMNKMLQTKIGDLENLIKSLLAQSQSHEKGDCKNGNCKMHEANSNPVQKGGKNLEHEKCFWCGIFGHFQADCEDLKHQIRIGNVKLNHENKLRLRDGSFIPKYPPDGTLKERVERHYARKPSQLYYGEYEDNDPTSSSATNILSQLLSSSNDAEKRTLSQLKAELDLRKREEALELRQKMLEENEKKMGQASSSTRAANVRQLVEQLTDEELEAIKTARSGFH